MGSSYRSKPKSVPLVVDLDGTLLKTDMLQEALCRLLATAPWYLFWFPFWWLRGKVYFKNRLAALVSIDVSILPYHAEVMSFIRQARLDGRQVILCSASVQPWVDSVAAQFPEFNEAYGTGRTLNLGGQNKAAFLVQRFGDKGFDYIGDRSVDWPVWRAARQVLTVGLSPRLRRRAEDDFDNVIHLVMSRSLAVEYRSFIKALRPHQWLKNILLFVPMILAQDFSMATLCKTLLAFVAFAPAASSVYLQNDLMDLENDRRHPRKCLRPLASGALPLWQGLLAVPALLLVALGLAIFWLPPAFLLILLLYYGVTLLYSFYLKRISVVDILTLAGLYTTRLMGGGMATNIALTPWQLAFSMFLFMALATVKRLAELRDAEMTMGDSLLPGRSYSPSDLPLLQQFATTSGFLSVLVLALYISAIEQMQIYANPNMLWGIPPLLLYWVARVLIKTHRGLMHDDPVVFAITDKVSLFTGWLVLLFVIAAIRPW